MWVRIKTRGLWLLSEAWRILAGAVKSFLEQPLKRIAIQVIGTVLGTWLISSEVQVHSTPPPKDYSQDFRRLDSLLSIARERTLTKDEFLAALEVQKKTIELSYQKRLDRISDSLSKLGDKITARETGSGTESITGGGQVKGGAFSDPWIDAFVRTGPRPDQVDIKYNFSFGIGDVSTRFVNADGQEKEVYGVFVRSLKDPLQVKYVGDYVKDIVALEQTPADLRRLLWDDRALSLDLVFGNKLEAGLALTPFSFSSGGPGAKEIIVRFPEGEISTDFKTDYHFSAGARLNAGHWLPVIRDFFISLKYAVGTSKGVLFAIGTTI